jgi:membrane-associated phospholipid phosphatase
MRKRLLFHYTVILVLVFFLLLFIQPALQAQDSVTVKRTFQPKTIIYRQDTLEFGKPRLWNNIKAVPRDLLGIAKYPFLKDHWIALSGIAVTSVILIANDQTLSDIIKATSAKIDLVPETEYKILWKPGNVRILKVPLNLNSALYQLGEGGTSLLVAGGLWAYGKIAKDYRSIHTAYDITETFISMGVTTQILKRISGRESPFMATQPGGRWQPFPPFSEYQKNTSSYDAFPSGHLATMMATVTVIASNYPEKKWIKPLGYTLITMTGWAMVNTDVHWVGDYPLAIAIGYISGKITTLKHKKVPVIYNVSL